MTNEKTIVLDGGQVLTEATQLPDGDWMVVDEDSVYGAEQVTVVIEEDDQLWHQANRIVARLVESGGIWVEAPFTERELVYLVYEELGGCEQ